LSDWLSPVHGANNLGPAFGVFLNYERAFDYVGSVAHDVQSHSFGPLRRKSEAPSVVLDAKDSLSADHREHEAPGRLEVPGTRLGGDTPGAATKKIP
jgi:hypothetical protein